MSDAALSLPAEARPILDVARGAAPGVVAAQFEALVRQSGLGVAGLVRAYAGLAFGPGKISFADFVKLRLFDRAFHADAALDSFVGARRNRDLCVTVNHRHDWLGLLTNKVASLSYLDAYGYPVIPVAAIYAPALATGKTTVLADRAALTDFLMTPEHYPLFGKPVESFQSLGSIGLLACEPGSRTVEKADGTAVPVDALVEEIVTHYAAGYLFQALMAPHPTIARLCGPRLATVRLITILTEDGPRLFRAAWKIPSGGNVADNFWRAGNLLAGIDIASGRIGQVVAGAGLDAVAVHTHPDTGAALADVIHPDWAAMRDLAIEGARLMRHVPLIGWDIAGTEHGPVIVEMNEAPDFFLPQFADRKGVLGAEFSAFVAFQKSQAAQQAGKGRAAIAGL